MAQRNARLLSLLAAIPIALIVTAPTHAATASVVVQPSTSTTSMPLPSWAILQDVTGDREVWLQPVLAVGQPEWDSSALLADANKTLAWFNIMSHGKFQMTATRVLDTARYSPPAPGASECNQMVRALSAADREFRNQDLSTVHLVSLSRVQDCPYGGLGETPGQTLIVTELTETPDIRGGTLIHELGHNLGLPHAAAYKGGVLSASRTASTVSDITDEYGDFTDPMGSSDASAPFGASALAVLGWGQGVYAVPDDTDGTFIMDLPEIGNDGPDAVVVNDPVSGKHYSFTYLNRPIESKIAGLPTGNSGVFIHEVLYDQPQRSPGSIGRTSYASLIPWDSAKLGIGGVPGMSWLSPSGAIRMTVDSLNGQSSLIAVTVARQGGIQDSTGPTWALGATPHLTRSGKGVGVIIVPAAWDQSGVTRLQLVVSGSGARDVRSSHQWAVTDSYRFPLRAGQTTKVTLNVYDSLGNVTTWSGQIKR